MLKCLASPSPNCIVSATESYKRTISIAIEILGSSADTLRSSAEQAKGYATKFGEVSKFTQGMRTNMQDRFQPGSLRVHAKVVDSDFRR